MKLPSKFSPKNKVKTILMTLIFVQVLVVGYLVYTIYAKPRVLGVSVTPIDKDSLMVTPDENLSFFFEPVPNQPLKYGYNGVQGMKGIASINSDSLNERFDYKVE